MKRIALLLLITFPCYSQVNIAVPNANGGNMATEEWVKTYMNGWLQRAERPTTDPDPIITPDPNAPICNATPLITNISNIGKNGIRATLTGSGITNVNWYIYKSNQTGLVVKQGNLPFATTLNIGWTGDIDPGDYILRITAINCTGSNTRAFNLPISGVPNPCLSGPVISLLNSTSRTAVNFTWSGLNVPEIVWAIKQNGNVIRTGSFVPTSQMVTVTYNTIPFGTYEFQLTGITCPTVTPSKSFTLFDSSPVSTTPLNGRHIYMNMTGYGFDVNDATGLSADWREKAEAFLNLTYQGVKFKGIDGIRFNMKWYEYEPSEGAFQDSKLLAAIKWCQERNIRLCVCIVPWRREGDNFLPNSDKSTLMNGKIWYAEGAIQDFTTYKTYQPSVQSTIARNKFKNCVKHLAQIMAQYPNFVDYISTSTALTEEYQLIRDESPLMMTGYSQVDFQQWSNYSGGLPVPYPTSSTVEAINAMASTANGRKWYEFQTKGLQDFHAIFVQGVKEGGLRSCGMYAGAGAPSAVFDYTYKLNQIFSSGGANQPDIIYSSEGDAGTQNSKLMATDLNIGTFPGSQQAIEFDPDDISQSQQLNPPYGTDLNNELFYNYANSFYRRGGEIVHFAMAFAPNKIPQLTESLYNIKTNFIESNMGMTGIDAGNPFTFPITTYTGIQGYRGQWSANGGGLNKQIIFTVQ